MLPDGGLAGFSRVAGSSGAISTDGSRVVWAGSEESGPLYLRDMASGETVQLDESRGGSGSGGSGHFWTMSGDGSKVFFTDEERLTSNSTATAGAPDLYECAIARVAGKLSCGLVDLTVEQGGSASVQGVLGVSENGEYVYFVADGVLANGASPQECPIYGQGLCNLYVRHDGVTKFIDALSSQYNEDSSDWALNRYEEKGEGTAQVSSDGSLVFISNRSLTGYDNNGPDCELVNSNEFTPGACKEVYVYDPSGGGRLFCASCSPSGEPPAAIAGAHSFEGGASLPIDRNRSYHMRWISEDGSRIFSPYERPASSARYEQCDGCI